MVISKQDLTHENKKEIKKFIKSKGLDKPATDDDTYKGEGAEIDVGCTKFTRDKEPTGAGVPGAPELPSAAGGDGGEGGDGLPALR